MDKLSQLTIHSTVNELELVNSGVKNTLPTAEVFKIFNKKGVPGVLILSEEQELIGMISRTRFFEYLSKPYNKELFFNKPISDFYLGEEAEKTDVMNGSVKISEATLDVLARPTELLYEPVIVKINPKEYRLLEVQQLLLAQMKIYKLTSESLKEADELKSELLSIVAHDLKNPLHTVAAFAELLLDPEIRIAEINQIAASILNSSRRMETLINSTLDATAIELGQITVLKSEINIRHIVLNVIENNNKNAERKGQKIHLVNDETCKIEEDCDCLLNGDPIRIYEAMDNIISNAIKYSPYYKSIYIKLVKQEEFIIISVIDEGPGFTENDKKHLFNKYTRLSARPTGGESSTGLGLFIVKKIIDLHQGKIWVEENKPCGSIFKIKLPVFEEKKASVSKKTSRPVTV